jgi:Family of unknown function (DUF6941)
VTRTALKPIDVIICDEVRQEITGKLIVVGMYLGNIGVPKVPVALPGLSFLCKWSIVAGARLGGTFQVVGPSGRTVHELETPEGPLPESATGQLLTMVRIQPFQINEVGQHSLMFRAVGGRRKAIARFEVYAKDSSPQSN